MLGSEPAGTWPRARLGVAGHYCTPTLPDLDESFVRHSRQGVLGCRQLQPVPVSYLPRRWHFRTSRELTRANRVADLVGDLPPCWAPSGCEGERREGGISVGAENGTARIKL